jgi:hypothetical protein
MFQFNKKKYKLIYKSNFKKKKLKNIS